MENCGPPDRPFRNFEPRNTDRVKVYVVWKCRSTDFEALKLRKGRSGINN